VLLLDEPASGLDPEARIALSKLFLSLRDQGMTLVVSSHILAELEDYASDVLILSDGRLLDHHGMADGAQRSVIDIRLSSADARLSTLLQQREGIELLALQEGEVRIAMVGDESEQAALLRVLVAEGLPVCSFAMARTDLQKIYVERMQRGHQGRGAA
jgi:ABC-2 type transport system ATP-binding protein